ncbi:MAG: GNAT family N-acetyltransferase [Candidatus Electrothrix gigas]
MDIIRLESLVERCVAHFPFKNELTEFPWQSCYDRLRQADREEMFTIIYENQAVGAMYLKIGRDPELVFFEIDPAWRGRGIGRAALELLFEHLMLQKFKTLIVQTGLPEIYTGLGFDIRKIDRGHISIDLFEPYPASYHSLASDTNDKQGILIYSKRYLVHDHPQHPENGSRVEHIISCLHQQKVLEKLQVRPPRLALNDELRLAHTQEMIRRVEKASCEGFSVARDTPTGPDSYDLACLSVGGALLAGEIVTDASPVIVLCRPPGHHAGVDKSQGFCFFNNIAILALTLYERGHKPMIIDWDAHHGNGTQEILYDKPIMYTSLHQRYLYPFSGSEEETGEGEGLGWTRNFPLGIAVEDKQYLRVFSEVEDVANEIEPDILLISAGQDGHEKDPLTGMSLSTAAYYELGRRVGGIARKHCQGRLILLLEGGYNLHFAALSLAQAVKGILETIRAES